MQQRQKSSLLIAGFFLFLLFGCDLFRKAKQEASAEKSQAPLTVAFTETAKKVELFDELTYPGQVLAATQTEVIAEIEGLVVHSQLELGRAVAKGSSLLSLENTDPVYKYAPLVVHSPVAGVISEYLVTVGSRVQKGQKLAVVSDLRSPKVRIEVVPNDLPKLPVGTAAVFETGVTGPSVPLKIRTINPIIGQQTGTATVELYAKDGQKLSPGLMGRVLFKTGHRLGFSVPEDALVYRGDQPFLRLINDDRIHYQPVTLGVSQKGRMEITTGLAAGNTWVHRSSAYVAEGEAVTSQSTEMAKK